MNIVGKKLDEFYEMIFGNGTLCSHIHNEDFVNDLSYYSFPVFGSHCHITYSKQVQEIPFQLSCFWTILRKKIDEILQLKCTICLQNVLASFYQVEFQQESKFQVISLFTHI